ncbi:T9SS type A sorting domain-containing protein [Polaribacter sp.]|uniref:T9SS type A sorting domain-containing protein n=1 Tax=Polaribacter sp. TaxID=1920175 RepID=UPI003EF53338
MKKIIITLLFLASSIFSYAQLYDIHDLDDCKSLTEYSQLNGTYTKLATNPDAGDTANPNVSKLKATASNGQVRFNLPFNITEPSTISWSIRIYSANGTAAGNTGSVSLRLFQKSANNLGTDYISNLGTFSKTGGVWQTLSGTMEVTATHASITKFDGINILISTGGTSFEDLYFDDLQFSINPDIVIADDTADLLAGNVWLYDNRVGNLKTSITEINSTADENITTPTTSGNATEKALRVTRGTTKFSSVKFDHGDLNYNTAGSVKFRIFPACINTGTVTPSVKYFIRKNNLGSTQRSSSDISLTANIWNEITIDLSTLTGGGSAATIFDDSLLFFNVDDQPGANGAVYYIDAFQVPASTATWTGSTDTDWATGANWDINTTPNSLFNVSIPTGKNPVISSSTGAKVNNLTVDGAGSLTVNAGGSLIVEGTSTGNITYNVNVADTNWHLISSPVVGATYGDAWNSANNVDQTGQSNTLAAVSTYTNTSAAAGSWNYFTNGASDATFNTGQGYSLKRTAVGDYVFTGAVQTASLTPTITTNDLGGANENRWNLLGNPFSSYLSVEDLLTLTANATALEDSSEALYVWNGSAYVGITTGYVYPGQAFFVNSNAASTTFALNEDMLSHQTTATFYRTTNSDVSLTLMMNDGATFKSTEITYSEAKTTGLDARFDIGAFTGVATDFSVYTQLVSDYKGVGFMRQALPNSDYENMIVSVGVKAAAGKELSFTADALNLPEGIKVFLEDRVANTFTRLDEENANYKITLTEALNGVGRFYLHTAQSALSVSDDAILNSIHIFNTSNRNLRITGLSEGKASLSLYNLLGKKVMTSSFDAANVQDISLPKLATGVYIVSLKATSGTVNKKIILD